MSSRMPVERQIEHAPKAGVADQRPGTRDQRVDVFVLVAALRFIRRQVCEHRAAEHA